MCWKTRWTGAKGNTSDHVGALHTSHFAAYMASTSSVLRCTFSSVEVSNGTACCRDFMHLCPVFALTTGHSLTWAPAIKVIIQRPCMAPEKPKIEGLVGRNRKLVWALGICVLDRFKDYGLG